MQMKEAIKFALTISNGSVLSVIDEMSDAATTFPTTNGGCHPLWVLGHLTLVEGAIPAALFGEKNPAAEWQRYFGEGSEAVADAAPGLVVLDANRFLSNFAGERRLRYFAVGTPQ